MTALNSENNEQVRAPQDGAASDGARVTAADSSPSTKTYPDPAQLDEWVKVLTDYDNPTPSLKKAWGHFKTITHHKILVGVHCFKVGLYKQGLLHDLSKYSPTEFMTGARYYLGTRSPNAIERAQKGYCEAWLHHKGRNRHHFEYWIDMKGKGDITLVGMPMPTRYVVEMFCDRIAACKVYRKNDYADSAALEYFNLESSKGELPMHEDAKALLLRLLNMLAEQGEEATFAYVREHIVRARYTESPRTHY